MLKKQMLWSLVDKIIKAVAAIISLSLVSKSLAITNFGDYVTLISLGGVFLALTNIGSESLIPKLVANNETLNEFIFLKIAASFFFGFIFIIICTIAYPSIDFFYLALFSANFLFVFFSYNEFIYIQKGKVEIFSKISIFIQITSLFIKFLYVYNDGTSMWFWLVILSSEYLSLGLLTHYALRQKVSIKGLDFLKVKKIASDVMYISLSSVAIAAYMRIDTLMISYFLGSDEAGKYFAGARLSEGVYFIGIALASILYSYTLNNKSNTTIVKKSIARCLIFLMFLGFIGTILINFISDAAIIFLYGDGYYESAKVLAIHSTSIMFVFAGGYLSRLYINCGFAKKNLRRTIIALLTNIILTYILIPRFGIVGAAYATVISQIMSSFLLFMIDRVFVVRLLKGVV
nr:polysaccharide biosynthesis C-terminal domain-containing protein [Serratia fonticola]